MPDDYDDRTLSVNAFLAAFAPEDWCHLRPHLRTVHLERGTLLAEPGAEVTRVYFPLDCLVSQTVPMVDGGISEEAMRARDQLSH